MRRVFRFVLLASVLMTAAIATYVVVVGGGVGGERQRRGDVATRSIPEAVVLERSQRQTSLDGMESAATTQILFGDLHVHTTYSSDAFVFSLPLMQGEGAHPPADACDFARFCSELDFYSINDHAEHLTPWQWEETKQSIRECNAVASDSEAPDLVAFLGWEWTQSSPAMLGAGRPHYGHKNVILLDTAEEKVPRRPIGAGSGGLFPTNMLGSVGWAVVRSAVSLGDFPRNLDPYLDLSRFALDVSATDECPEGVAVRDLPPDCLEGAATPEVLFRKLDDWGFPNLVIPHGTAWGIHAPPAADLGDQLRPGSHDATSQRLFEVYSGHGTGELWRDLRDTETGADGKPRCAAPRDGYEPCCWRAGEIVRARCGEESDVVCEERVAKARQWFVDAGAGDRARGVVPGTQPADWLECGQLAGSFLPAFEYRTKMSAQYGLARRPEGAASGADGAFRFGLIGSSDNHKARAGSGYKELGRKEFGDAYGLRSDWRDRLLPDPIQPAPEPVPPDALPAGGGFGDPGSERGSSYYFTGGLVAVHAQSRRRESIFEALAERRAYATSGPRIALHFDLENGSAGPVAMGGEAKLRVAPRFRVRALGAFEQKPGCPEHTLERLSPERVQLLCRNECYHPGDTRTPIERIEVVRIRPQTFPDEPLDELIDDPWRSFECDDSGGGCDVTFVDESYDPEREHLYYVRALQVATPAVNGDPMRCERDPSGQCVAAKMCPASGAGFDPGDDCLAPVQERAWSSPIFLSGAEVVATSKSERTQEVN